MTNVHESISKDEKPTLKEIETARSSSRAYTYLVHLEECKQWIEHILGKKYDSIRHFEDELPKAIDLCLISLNFSPESIKKIYYGKKEDTKNAQGNTEMHKESNNNTNKRNIKVMDEQGTSNKTKHYTADETLSKSEILDYRFTDNIYYFLLSLKDIGLPSYFFFDTVSLYEKKNIPSVIFCLHALSHFLKFKGIFEKGIDSLTGIKFSRTLIEEKDLELREKEVMGYKIPEFRNIKSIMHRDAIRDLIIRVKYLSYLSRQKGEKMLEQARMEMVRKALQSEIEEMKEREKEISSRECINDPCNAKECQNTNCTNHNSKTKETHKCFFECKKGSCFSCNEVLQKRIITRNKIIEVMERFIVNSNSSLIARKLKTFIYQKSFNEIYSKNEISLFTIKFYIFIFFENANEIEKEAKINKLIKKSDSERWANYKIESYLDELEIRINLLMDNKISITNFSITKPRIEDILSPACDVGDYDFAFYVLQSQPYFMLNILEEEENLNEFILEYIISLFCNGRREEMYLCRFIEDSVCRIEKSYSKMIKKSNTRNEDNLSLTIKSTIENIKLYNALRLLLNHFFRGCDTKFKDALLKIIENLNSVDIENDPSKIYSNLYGRKVSIENALENNAVRVTFITRIKTLRAVIISIVETIKKNIINLPFPVRYFFKHIFRMLNKQHKRNTKTNCKSEDYNSEEREMEEGNKNYQNYNEFEEGSKSGNTFNDEAQSDILDSSLTTFMLSIFYKDFLFPFLIAPDAFTNFEISRSLRDKLKMINKAFECIIEGKRYTILKSLDKFFNETHSDLSEIMNEIADVNDIDKEFLYLVSIDVDKPHVVYSGRQVNSFMKQIKDKLRRRINKNKAEISRKKNDENITKDSFRDSFEMINNKLSDLSINKRNTKDELQKDSTPEYKLYHFINNIKPLPETNKPITFYLNKPFVEEKKDSEKQKMFEDVKMKIVRLLKFANGRNILDMLVRQSSEKEEESFIEYQLSLINERRNMDHSVNNSLLQYLNKHDQGQVDETLAENGESLPKLNTLGSFKDAVFDDMIRLEETGLVSKDNFYNEMLYALADDIIRIKLMSLERNKKLESLDRFLVELHDRRTRLNKKIVVHEKYLFSLISSMMNKKVGLEGYKSYKESANKLANKGILVKLEGNMNKSAKDIHFLFQTEEAGVFTVNLYINKKTNCGSFRFRFDDILKLKFEGREEFMIDKICILNVSKLIDYINKRYIAE